LRLPLFVQDPDITACEEVNFLRQYYKASRWARGQPLLTGGDVIVTFWKFKTAFFAAYGKTSASDDAFSRYCVADLAGNRVWLHVGGRAGRQEKQQGKPINTGHHETSALFLR